MRLYGSYDGMLGAAHRADLFLSGGCVTADLFGNRTGGQAAKTADPATGSGRNHTVDAGQYS